MGKIVWVFIGVIGVLFSHDIASLEKECLRCHQNQQIPNKLIYKRYLKKYSTSKRIEKMMLQYLKNPQKEHSIMPPQFFFEISYERSAIFG